MVSCLMGDSTALASAIVRCCLKFEFRVALYGKYAIIPHVDRAPASEILEPHRGAARSRIQAGE